MIICRQALTKIAQSGHTVSRPRDGNWPRPHQLVERDFIDHVFGQMISYEYQWLSVAIQRTISFGRIVPSAIVISMLNRKYISNI